MIDKRKVITVLLMATGVSLQFGVASASSMNLTDNHQHNGNARYARSSSVVNSPNINKGVQQTVNVNNGGFSVIQNAYCKRRHFCRIPQTVYMSIP